MGAYLFDQFPFGGGASIALPPVNLATGANNSLWASVRDINDSLLLLFYFGAGTAGQNITVTLQQALNSSGGSAKALVVKEAWFKRGGAAFTAGNAAARDVFVKSAIANREVAAANYDTTADRVASTSGFMGIIRISPKDLDMVNNFRYVRAQFTQPAAAQQGVALWVPNGAAYQGTQPLSLLV